MDQGLCIRVGYCWNCCDGIYCKDSKLNRTRLTECYGVLENTKGAKKPLYSFNRIVQIIPNRTDVLYRIQNFCCIVQLLLNSYPCSKTLHHGRGFAL